MEITPLCLMLSTLVVHPDRSQFLLYETLTLTCGGPGCSDGWTLLRNTSTQTSQPCPSAWGVATNGSTCAIGDAYPSDSGVYWCGSERHGRSGGSGVHIAVSDSDVILQSPALPVTEGDRVTLRCASSGEGGGEGGGGGGGARRWEPQPAASAAFYKDGVMIGNRSAANVTFVAVSRSDEGLYWCEIPARGTSPRSRLAVRVPAEPPPDLPLPRLVCVVLLIVLLTVLNVLIFAVCVKLRRRLTRRSSASM
ncbi:uncharacterized protein ACO6RY_03159 [Pungitius sinensis]